MEEISNFLKRSDVLSILGIILLLTAVLDVTGASILFLKIKASYGVFVLAVYHILRGITQFFEE